MSAVCARKRSVQGTVFLVLMLFSSASVARADTCTWNILAILGGNWSSNFSCIGPNGSTYPGEKGPDTANISGLNLGATITINASLASPVNLQLNPLLLSPNLNIPAGNKLILATGSSAPSATTI